MLSKLSSWRRSPSLSNQDRANSSPDINRTQAAPKQHNFMGRRNFHQNSDRPWQYYLDSGCQEYQIMQQSRDDRGTTTLTTYTDSSSVTGGSIDSRSRSSSEADNMYSDVFLKLFQGDEHRSSLQTTDDMDTDDDNFSFDDGSLIAPEGVNVIPFKRQRGNRTSGPRLSSTVSSALETRYRKSSMNQLHFEFHESPPTPSNSPQRQ
jgi:hypothetical protein